jgi:hypothetical protein
MHIYMLKIQEMFQYIGYKDVPCHRMPCRAAIYNLF